MKYQTFRAVHFDSYLDLEQFQKVIVGFVIRKKIKKEECILIQKRADNQQWGLPGGHFEWSEDFNCFEGAKRETWEEAGLLWQGKAPNHR